MGIGSVGLFSEDASQRLRIHGLGLLRYRMISHGYAAALCLPDGASGRDALADVPRWLELSYFGSIAGKDFGGSANQLLARGYDAAASVGSNRDWSSSNEPIGI